MNTKRFLVKGFPKFGLSHSGLQRFLFSTETVVFLYHEVNPRPSDFHSRFNLNITPKAFDRQISWIKNFFNVISPQELLSGKYSRPAALITFDDGSKGYFDYAVPILERHGCPSLIFLNMAPILGDIFWSGLVTYLCVYEKWIVHKIIYSKKIKPPYYLYLNIEDVHLAIEGHNDILMKAREFYGSFASVQDLKNCENSGLVYFGNHLWNHYNSTLAVKDELFGWFMANQKEIDRYVNGTRFFSYPFGQKDSCYNEKTHALLFNLGARAVFCATPETFKTDGTLYYRLPMDGFCESEQEFKAYLSLIRLKQFSRGA